MSVCLVIRLLVYTLVQTHRLNILPLVLLRRHAEKAYRACNNRKGLLHPHLALQTNLPNPVSQYPPNNHGEASPKRKVNVENPPVSLHVGGSTVDGRKPAPPIKPLNDESPVNTNKRYGFPWFQSGGFRPSTVFPANVKADRMFF